MDFLPGAVKGVFADCIGVHGVLTICCLADCIDEAPPGSALTARFHQRREGAGGGKLYRMSSMDVSACVF